METIIYQVTVEAKITYTVEIEAPNERRAADLAKFMIEEIPTGKADELEIENIRVFPVDAEDV